MVKKVSKSKEKDLLKQLFLEISTPLESILRTSESLLAKNSSEMSHALLSQIKYIRTNSEIIASYLDSLDHKHEFFLSVCSVTELMVHLESVFHKEYLQEHLQIELPNPDLLIKVDETLFLKTLISLVDKAIHSSNNQVQIRVSRVDDFVSVLIEDDGPGIPSNIMKKIETDLGGDNSDANAGFLLANSLMKSFSGSFHLSSHENEGTTAELKIPLASKDPIEKSTELDGVDEELPIALIIDDEPVERLLMGKVVKNIGFKSISSANGTDALDKLKKYGCEIKLILLDLFMPGISGLETLKEIRKTYSATEIPVMMLTGNTYEADIVEAFNSGANDYVTKPFIQGELVARIQTHMSLSRATESYRRFVPTEFISLLGKESVPDLKLGDQKELDITVMFTDIRNFTSLSEGLSPKDNFDFINDYLSRIVPIIKSHGGFIDKFIGDSVMALFNDDPIKAVLASIEIQDELRRYSAVRLEKGLPALEVGTGIHQGKLMLGVIGEKTRIESTVISDAVNIASRLEGLTKTYGTSTIISESALDVSNFRHQIEVRPLSRVKVKGRENDIRIYEIMAATDEVDFKNRIASRDRLTKALSLYEQGDVKEALILLQGLIVEYPDDGVIRYFYNTWGGRRMVAA